MATNVWKGVPLSCSPTFVTSTLFENKNYVGIEHHCYYASDICQFLSAILAIWCVFEAFEVFSGVDTSRIVCC